MQYSGDVQMRHPPGQTGGHFSSGDRHQSRGSSYDPHGPQMPFPRQEFERNEIVTHIRQRSGDSGDNRFLNKSFSESSDRSGRLEESFERVRPPSFNDNREKDKASPRNSSHSATKVPPKVAEKPVSPGHQHKASPVFLPSSPTASAPRPMSPRLQEAPRSPTFPGGPMFSASNLESRMKEDPVEEPSQPRPVAKVPPHLVAGVKVLPTGFSKLALKPHSPRDDKPNKRDMQFSDHSDYDNVGFKNGKPVLMSESFGEDRVSYQSNWDRDGPGNTAYGMMDQPRKLSGQDYGRNYGQLHEDQRYIEHFDDHMTTRVQVRSQDYRGNDPRSPANRYSMPPVMSADRSYDNSNRWSNNPKSTSSYEMGGGRSRDGYASDSSDPRKKEQEIANMFSNFRVQGGGVREHRPGFTGPGNNFEQSLGYYP